MTESFTHTGVWFTPENPDNRLSGTLSFDLQTGIELELVGTLVASRSHDNIHEPKFILGLTTDGKTITLYRSFESSRSMHLPGMPTCKYVVLYVLSGAHFERDEDFVFHSVRGRLRNLETWISKYGFSVVETDFTTKTTKVEYTLPNSVEFSIRPTVKGKLNFTSSVPSSPYTNSVTIEQKAEVIIEHEKAISFEGILDDFFHFQNFLTLGTFEASHPLVIRLSNRDLQEELNEEISQPVLVQVFFQYSIAVRPARNRIHWEFLFHYHDIADTFGTIVQGWYMNHTTLRPVTDLLFDSFYKSGTFTENMFLNICQALETFHRRFRKNEVRPKGDHERMIGEIVETTSAEHKDWLKGRLHFSNEPTLHARLDELIEELSNNTVKKIITDKEAFIKEVKNSRNYYTHYDKSTERKAKKGAELFTLTEKLKVVLVCAVLKQTGFSADQIEALFDRNEFKFFNHILSPVEDGKVETPLS